LVAGALAVDEGGEDEGLDDVAELGACSGEA